MQWNTRRALALLAAFTVVFAGAVAGYMIWEQLDLLSAIYFVIVAITTVGFGDIHPTTTAGQILTIVFVPAGIVLLFGLGFTMVQHHLDELILRGGYRPMKRQLDQMQGHYIVCGYGRLGRITADSLQRLGRNLVIIDHDPDKQKELDKKGYPYVIDDALQESSLIAAGIKRCSGVIATFNDDTQNVYLALEVRDIRPDVDTVSAASSRQSARRLYMAGAKCVVTASIVGGELLAKSAINPHVYHLMSDIATDTTEDNISQIIINSGSQLESLALKDLKKHNCYARILVVRKNGETELVPTGEYQLTAGAVVVAVGAADQLGRLEELGS